MIERIELIARLETVEPALADNNLVPILSYMWFTGSHVMAFNDRIGISTPLRTDFQGALPGKLLLEFLRASRARQLEISPQGDSMQIKAASARIKLPALPPEFPWKMPQFKRENTGGIEQAGDERNPLFAAIEDCLRCVKPHGVKAEQIGVTVELGRQMKLWATDDTSIVHSLIEPTGNLVREGRIILRADFCRQMLRFKKASQAASAKLMIANEFVLFGIDDIVLFGKLLVSDAPVDFDRIYQRHMSNGTREQMIAMPRGIGLVLDRACLAADIKGRTIPTRVVVADGHATFTSQSERADVVDRCPMPHHPDVSVGVRANYMRDAYEHYDQMLIKPEVVVMARGNSTYLMGTKE